MASELFVLAGSAGEAARRDRRVRIEHAAVSAHGRRRSELFERGGVTIALVDCAPVGGDTPVWRIEDHEAQCGIVLDPQTTSVSQCGSESPGVLLTVDERGFRLTTDRIGFLPLYRAGTAAEVAFSTSLHAMVSLGHADESEPATVIEYLTCLHPLGDRTLLRGVEVVPPGATIRWNEAGSSDEQYAPLIAPTEAQLDRSEAIQRFRSSWPDATSSRTADPATAVGLSGGLDSRAILGGMLTAGLAPTAFTWGDDRAEEVVIARRVAAALGVDHVVAPVRESMRLARTDSTAAWLDGTQSIAEVYEAWDPEPIRAIGPTIVTGTSGDVFWGSDKAGGARTIGELRPKLVRRYAAALVATAGVLDLDPTDVATSFDESLDGSLEPFASLDRGDLSTFWNLHHRQRRWGAGITMAMRRSGLRVAEPLLREVLRRVRHGPFAGTTPPWRASRRDPPSGVPRHRRHPPVERRNLAHRPPRAVSVGSLRIRSTAARPGSSPTGPGDATRPPARTSAGRHHDREADQPLPMGRLGRAPRGGVRPPAMGGDRRYLSRSSPRPGRVHGRRGTRSALGELPAGAARRSRATVGAPSIHCSSDDWRPSRHGNATGDRAGWAVRTIRLVAIRARRRKLL